MLRSSLRQKKVNNFGSIERHVQLSAFNDLLDLRKTSNKKRRGDIKQIIERYHQGNYYCVTRQNLEYRLRLYEKGAANLFSDNISALSLQTPPVSNVYPHRFVDADDLSSLSYSQFDHSATNSKETVVDTDAPELDASVSVPGDNDANKGGRKIGTTLKSKKANDVALKFATNSVATKYLDLQAQAKFIGKKVKRIRLKI
jgi:hypothetical protein